MAVAAALHLAAAGAAVAAAVGPHLLYAALCCGFSSGKAAQPPLSVMVLLRTVHHGFHSGRVRLVSSCVFLRRVLPGQRGCLLLGGAVWEVS